MPHLLALLPPWRGLFAAALALTGCLLQAGPAVAIDVTCIEASRYKYIYLIFNNDRRRFAQFFGLDSRKLPSPETCRAAVITGRIERATREGGDEDSDFGAVANAISDSGGWLTTLYVASSGGASTMGLRIGFLTRSFWLKTHSVEGTSFDYVPDFLGPGPGLEVTGVRADLEAGWQAYLEATRGVRTVDMSDNGRRRRCASACTFIHAGGIHRSGYPYFHRGRMGRPGPQRQRQTRKSDAPEPSMSQMVEGLHKQEARILAFFRLMDVGEAAVRARQTTATQTVRRAAVRAMPRYIDDHLRTACKLPVRKRADEPPEQQNETSQSPLTFDAPDATANAATTQDQQEPRSRRRFGSDPQGEPKPPRERRQRTVGDDTISMEGLYCIAAAHERERLRQFAKLCSHDCDVRSLARDANRRVIALVAEEERPRSRRKQSSSGDDPPRRRLR